jgi:hypothetical protein
MPTREIGIIFKDAAPVSRGRAETGVLSADIECKIAHGLAPFIVKHHILLLKGV